MAPQTITAPSQTNHMLRGKTTPVARSTSDIGHDGFGAADDIEVRLRNLTDRHGVVRRHDAASMGQPVLVDFSAIGCPTCRVLHAEVFTNAELKRAITADCVLSRVDYESPGAQPFTRRYGVQRFPSLLVLSVDGLQVRRVPVSFDRVAFAASLRGLV